MRYRIAFCLLAFAALLLVLAPSSTRGQPGFGGAGFGGGKKGKKGGGTDPSQVFALLSKGRGYILPSEISARLRDALGQYLQGKTIPNGQVTLDIWMAFYDQIGSATNGAGGGFQAGGFQGGFPGGGFQRQGGFAGAFGPQAGGNPLDTINQLAAAEFNFYDRNGDGFLNQDEMPPQLKAELSKWDSSHDNLISFDEYKFYYASRMQNQKGRGNQLFNPINIIIEEEDLDEKPFVARAGKLSSIKELPSWFIDLDSNKDGQIDMYEWRKGGKDLDEFQEWDRNDDGFITADEAMSKQRLIMLARGDDEDAPSPKMMRSPKGNGFNGGGEDFVGKFNKGGKGGKGKGGKGGKGGKAGFDHQQWQQQRQQGP